MSLLLDDMREEFARFLTADPAARFRMDAALAHVVTIAYQRGLEDGKTTESERADYAWRNTNTIEKARQEEMARRDAIQAILRQLITEADDNPFTTVGHFVEHVAPRCRDHA